MIYRVLLRRPPYGSPRTLLHMLLLFLCVVSNVLSSSSSIVPLQQLTRPTKSVRPTIGPGEPSSSEKSQTSLLDAHMSQRTPVDIDFRDFIDAMDGIYFASVIPNTLASMPDMIFDALGDGSKQHKSLSSIRIAPYVDISMMLNQLDEHYSTYFGLNTTELEIDGKISDPHSLSSLFSPGIVKALSWRTQPHITASPPPPPPSSSVSDMISSQRPMMARLGINSQVIYRYVTSSFSGDVSAQMQYIVLKLLILDAKEKQDKYRACLKLIEESPAYELFSRILPDLREETEIVVSKTTLVMVLKRVFRLFNLTSFQPTYDGLTLAKDYFSPSVNRVLYDVSIDGIYPHLLGNFAANTARGNSASFRAVRLGSTRVDRVYVAADISSDVLDGLKRILGFNELSGTFEEIGKEKDTVLADMVHTHLSGVPNRTRIIGVLLGWLRESFKMAIQRNVEKVVSDKLRQ